MATISMDEHQAAADPRKTVDVAPGPIQFLNSVELEHVQLEAKKNLAHAPILCLPPELITDCASFLSIPEVIRFSASSSLIREILINAPSLWTNIRICAGVLDRKTYEEYFRTLVVRSRNLPLHVTWERKRSYYDNNPWQDIASNIYRIESLLTCDDSHLASLASPLPMMKRLTVIGTNPLALPKAWGADGAPHLTDLSIPLGVLPADMEPMESVQSLTIWVTHPCQGLFRIFPRIRKLSIRGASEDVVPPGPLPRSLEECSISGVYSLIPLTSFDSWDTFPSKELTVEDIEDHNSCIELFTQLCPSPYNLDVRAIPDFDPDASSIVLRITSANSRSLQISCDRDSLELSGWSSGWSDFVINRVTRLELSGRILQLIFELSYLWPALEILEVELDNLYGRNFVPADGLFQAPNLRTFALTRRSPYYSWMEEHDLIDRQVYRLVKGVGGPLLENIYIDIPIDDDQRPLDWSSVAMLAKSCTVNGAVVPNLTGVQNRAT